MNTHLGRPSLWLFFPFSLMVAWAVNGQTVGMTAMIVIMFGFACTVLGCFLTVAHSESRHQKEAEALANLRAQYNNALQVQLVNMRKALIALTARALRNAAGKLVSDLLTNFDNDEQYDAAILRATDIVNAEITEVADIIGEDLENADDVQSIAYQ